LGTARGYARPTMENGLLERKFPDGLPLRIGQPGPLDLPGRFFGGAENLIMIDAGGAGDEIDKDGIGR